MRKSKSENAAVLIIGNEILSGRTLDLNFSHITKTLNNYGISVLECRTIPDDKDEIISSINTLREKYKYVFTTGGIGPTHDDITSESIAEAFQVEIETNKDAYNILENYYKKNNSEFNEVRQRMARIPVGAKLIHNKISGAPGFKIGNVFVFAGIPKIMRSMLDESLKYINPQKRVNRINIQVKVPEGEIAKILEKTLNAHLDLEIGSYPFFDSKKDFGVNIELSSKNKLSLERAISYLKVQLSEESIKYK